MSRQYESPSSLHYYKKCPYAYKLKYVDKGERKGESEAATFGKYIHKIMERIFNFVIEAKFTGGLDSRYIRRVARETAPEFNMDDVKIEHAYHMVSNYMKRHGPIDYTRHIANEKEYQLDIPGLGPVKMVMDRIDRIGEDEALVIDYKSGKDWNDYHFQVTLYLYAVKSLYDWAMHSRFRIDFVRLEISKDFKITPGELAQRMDEIIFIKQRIDGEHFNPIIGNHCRFCDFRGVCPYVKKKG